MKALQNKFKTPEYDGIWLSFDGNRMAFRREIELQLRRELEDHGGSLIVDDRGPHWKSPLDVQLSYSHSGEVGVLVYSRTHFIGVDIESENREFRGEPLKLAIRFFPADEVKVLKMLPQSAQKTAFLRLWVQKEAFAKITRLGLGKTLEHGVRLSETQVIRTIPVAPIGMFGAVIFEPRK